MYFDNLSKFIIWIFFIIFIYNIIININDFFGTNKYINYMYTFWFAILFLFVVLLSK
jgi:hypothetical protein